MEDTIARLTRKAENYEAMAQRSRNRMFYRDAARYDKYAVEVREAIERVRHNLATRRGQ